MRASLQLPLADGEGNQQHTISLMAGGLDALRRIDAELDRFRRGLRADEARDERVLLAAADVDVPFLASLVPKPSVAEETPGASTRLPARRIADEPSGDGGEDDGGAAAVLAAADEAVAEGSAKARVCDDALAKARADLGNINAMFKRFDDAKARLDVAFKDAIGRLADRSDGGGGVPPRVQQFLSSALPTGAGAPASPPPSPAD